MVHSILCVNLKRFTEQFEIGRSTRQLPINKPGEPRPKFWNLRRDWDRWRHRYPCQPRSGVTSQTAAISWRTSFSLRLCFDCAATPECELIWSSRTFSTERRVGWNLSDWLYCFNRALIRAGRARVGSRVVFVEWHTDCALERTSCQYYVTPGSCRDRIVCL